MRADDDAALGDETVSSDSQAVRGVAGAEEVSQPAGGEVVSPWVIPAAPTEAPLVGYLDDLVRQLGEYIPLALLDFEQNAVHQARVATRRLAAAFGLLEPLLERSDLRPVGRLLKKLRRRLGPHRDLDVLIDHLMSFGQHAPVHAAATAHLVSVLSARRLRLREKSLRKGGAEKSRSKLGGYLSLRESLLGHAEANDFAPLIAEGVQTGFEEFSLLADLLSHQLSEREGLTGIDPHELRIAGKHLRYSLELAAANATALPAEVFKDFKKMQDALGLWHDHVVLADTSLEYLADSALLHRDAELAASILGLAREAAEVAGSHLSRFAELWTVRGPVLTETVRTAFPLSRGV
jgi:CHAD domain-containing protein